MPGAHPPETPEGVPGPGFLAGSWRGVVECMIGRSCLFDQRSFLIGFIPVSHESACRWAGLWWRIRRTLLQRRILHEREEAVMDQAHPDKRLLPLTLGAIGVVYGDIGT